MLILLIMITKIEQVQTLGDKEYIYNCVTNDVFCITFGDFGCSAQV